MRPDTPPIDHTVRVSKRARKVRLLVTHDEGLVVVVPRGFPRSRIAAVLRDHERWIERALERTAERRARSAQVADAPVPEFVEMPGIGVSWEVELWPTATAGVRGAVRDGILTLTGGVSDASACRAAIRRAVSRVARERLPLMLGSAEAETGWSASTVAVRRQRTRWGSCTGKGRLSLNESLVFLPQRLVRHVMVHELAHTRRMDHSPAFWALVERFDASWRDARAELREAWRYVPAWADAPRTEAGMGDE